MLWIIIKMLLALALVSALLFLALKFFKQVSWQRKNESSVGGIKVLTSKLIAPQRYITLVEIGDEVLALGISPHHISFLTKIEDKESLRRRLPEGKAVNNISNWFGFWRSPLGQQRFVWAGEKNED